MGFQFRSRSQFLLSWHRMTDVRIEAVYRQAFVK